MLFEASHSREEGTDIAEVKRNPALAIYVEGWGRDGDVGVVAMSGGEPVGAGWVRKLKGYGFVADDIPELAIATAHGSEGRGIGSAMLRALIAECTGTFRAISLSVRLENPAAKLYRRFGFVEVDGKRITNRVGSTSTTMVLELPPYSS